MVVFKALNKSSKLDTIFKILESDLNVRSTLEKKKMLQNGETASRVEKQPLRIFFQMKISVIIPWQYCVFFQCLNCFVKSTQRLYFKHLTFIVILNEFYYFPETSKICTSKQCFVPRAVFHQFLFLHTALTESLGPYT